MPLYAACDLHSNNTVLAVLDEAGSLKLRQRVPNDLDLIGAALAPFRDQLQGVAVESTYNAYWLLDGLDRAGYPTRMVNTLAVPQYAGLKQADDHTDARGDPPDRVRAAVVSGVRRRRGLCIDTDRIAARQRDHRRPVQRRPPTHIAVEPVE